MTHTRVSTFFVLFSALRRHHVAQCDAQQSAGPGIVDMLCRDAECQIEELEVKRSIEDHADAPAGAHWFTIRVSALIARRVR
jgi:hypothetical protein